MATTSYIYHTLGLVRYNHLSTKYHQGAVYYHVTKKREERICSECNASWDKLTLEGRFERHFRALPVGRRPQWVVLHGHFQHCRTCGRTLREPIDFAQGKRRRLKAFDRYVVDLCRIAPIKQVAQLLAVGWDLVKGIFKEHLSHQLQKRKFSNIRYLAVDEFALRKGHHYMTIVLDLETGQILHAQEGKDAQALVPFLEKLKRKKVQPLAVAMDMSPAYLQAVRQVFPEVDIVHDPYHVVSMVNTAIDQTRRDIARELNDQDKQVIKGSRFLLLRGLESLNEYSLSKLMDLMEVNEPLYAAYLLKEDLRTFWNQPNEQSGAVFLDAWITQASSFNLPHFSKLAEALNRHRSGLLSYFRHRISTGPLEGLNNKIKVLKRQAYGFRDQLYFKLRLFFLHEQTPAFAG